MKIEEVSYVWQCGPEGYLREQAIALEPLFEAEDTRYLHHMRWELDENTMELVIVDNLFILYNSLNGDRNFIAEHDYDSEVGLLLRSGRVVR